MKPSFIILFLMTTPSTGGCFDDPFQEPGPAPPTTPAPTCDVPFQGTILSASLQSPSQEPLSVVVFGGVQAVPALTPVSLCLSVPQNRCGGTWRVDNVTADTADGVVTLDFGDSATLNITDGPCVAVPVAKTLLDTSTVTVHLVSNLSGDTETREVTMLKPQLGSDAITLATDSGGGLWMGTVFNGLVGIHGADITHFPGVGLADPFDPDFEGPQASAVTSLLFDAPQNALWVGTFITGVSRLSLETNSWHHFDLAPGVALVGSPVGPVELAQTPLALVGDGENQLWVGTGNGLYHMIARPNNTATFARATDGVIVTMDSRMNIDGVPQELWLGHTTEATPSAEDAPFWPKQTVALTVVHPGEVDRSDVSELVLDVPGKVVLSLLVNESNAYVGTDAGLFRAALTAGEPVSADLAFEEVDLPLGASVGMGAAAITALADDGDDGVWVGVAFECVVDGGALLRVHADGSVTNHSANDSGGTNDSDIAALIVLPDGTLVVSTHTMSLLMGQTLTPCQDINDKHRGDVYLVTPHSKDGATWEPLR